MKKPTTLQQLFAIDDSWCQCAVAVDKTGNQICVFSEEVQRRCLFGGVVYVYGSKHRSGGIKCNSITKDVDLKLNILAHRKGFGNYIEYSEHTGRTIEEIREFVKEAGV